MCVCVSLGVLVWCRLCLEALSEGVKTFEDRDLKVQLLEPVDVVNGFKERFYGSDLGVCEALGEDQECAFHTHLPRPFFDALLDALFDAF